MPIYKVNTGGQCMSFTYPTGAAAKYFVFKNGAAIGFGSGSIFQSGSPGVAAVILTMTAADVNVLGTIQIALLDAANNILAFRDASVLFDLPGGTVSSVVGNVNGSVLGNVLGFTQSIGAGTRVLLAQDVWNQVDTIESGLSARDAMRCLFAVMCGKDLVAPGSAGFRNFGDTKFRVVMTFDAASERTTVTYDFS